jgi:hypothetical protein
MIPSFSSFADTVALSNRVVRGAGWMIALRLFDLGVIALATRASLPQRPAEPTATLRSDEPTLLI